MPYLEFDAVEEGRIEPLKSSCLLSGYGKTEEEDMLLIVAVPSSTILLTQTQPSFPLCKLPFFNSISDAIERDGFISLGNDIPSTSLNNLYIRESYRTIASSINPGINKAIITGTPGIGKSLFMIYLLWKLVKEGKRVFVVYDEENFYFDEHGVVFSLETLPEKSNSSFWNETLWCLFDAKGKTYSDLHILPYKKCTFILSTSPRREMLNDFKKPPRPQVFYMPLWTETELKTIAPCFPSAINWLDRFKILGGVPRHVLEDTKDLPIPIHEAACNQCDLKECTKIIGLNSTITDKSKIVHSLVHVTSESPYTESSVCYASDVALDIIVRNKLVDVKLKIRQLLASCEGNPLSAALCGYIFEPYAIELLERGGTFNCRELVHGNNRNKPDETTLVIPSSIKTVVEKVDKEQTDNQLYVPKTTNFTAIDAWIPGIGAFQMTVGKKHDIKGRAKEDLAMLGQGANKLFWVLPPLYYHSFTKKNPQEIEQHAILIPYPE